METVKDKAQDFASSVADRAEDAWDGTKQSAQEWASSVADTAEDAWGGLNNFIRRYPVPSLLFALGLGFVLAEAMQCMTSSDGGRGYSR